MIMMEKIKNFPYLFHLKHKNFRCDMGLDAGYCWYSNIGQCSDHFTSIFFFSKKPVFF